MSAPRSPRTPSPLDGRRVLLGVTGGIAAYKAALLARLLVGAGADVTVVMTRAAERLVGPDTFAALTGHPALTSLWDRPGEVVHVRLAHDHDVAVIAPATANVIAKLANGLSDDLLTSTMAEFEGPVVIAPAMHSGMWRHAATLRNVRTLEGDGVSFIGPVTGALAHGDSGLGRFAEPEDIVREVERALDASGHDRDLTGRVIVVTAGPTFEPIDPVRFIGNRSSGKMGMAIAAEARSRGAEVRLILGPGTVQAPPGITPIHVSTAEEMRAAVLAEAEGADAVVMAAAVADFRPKAPAADKLKKELGAPDLGLEPTPDILAELGERRVPGRVLVGFAAETGDVVVAGRQKLERKHLDLLVANEVGRPGTGFGADTNHAAILAASGDDAAMREWTKAELARALLDRVRASLAPDGGPSAD
jgi:phosphopantothenoylcysteine decarboxylase / phosphopantothenate---cysteine ligase